MNDKTRALIFLAVLSLVVGNVLAGISLGLKQRIENNRKLLMVGSLLDVLQVEGRQDAQDAELLTLYEEKVEVLEGAPRVYTYEEDGRVEAYAFDVAGRGLWDNVKGLVAVDRDGVTVRGVRFYEQNETPGLGGDIGTLAFARQFEGKSLREGEDTLSIVKAGSVSDLSSTQVDGITGATMTGDAVNAFLADDIEAFLDRMEEME